MKHGNGYCHVHGEKRKCTYPQCSNYIQSDGLCIQHGYRKKNSVRTDAPTMTSGMVSASIMVQSAIAQSLGGVSRCFRHFWCLWFVTEGVLAAANVMVGMRHNASARTSGSVVGGQKFHFINHDATILDITDLTLEVIQQYVGMNNWENVLVFVSVCK
jgi:hypothetical protein